MIMERLKAVLPSSFQGAIAGTVETRTHFVHHKKILAMQTKLISTSFKLEEGNFWLCVNKAAVETWVNRRAQLIFTKSIGTSDTEISKLWRCVLLGY